jgi:hypothetical protein
MTAATISRRSEMTLTPARWSSFGRRCALLLLFGTFCVYTVDCLASEGAWS